MAQPEQRRHQKVRFDEREISVMLGIPEGATVVRLDARNDPPSITFTVAHPDFPKVDWDAEAPFAAVKVGNNRSLLMSHRKFDWFGKEAENAPDDPSDG